MVVGLAFDRAGLDFPDAIGKPVVAIFGRSGDWCRTPSVVFGRDGGVSARVSFEDPVLRLEGSVRVLGRGGEREGRGMEVVDG